MLLPLLMLLLMLLPVVVRLLVLVVVLVVVLLLAVLVVLLVPAVLLLMMLLLMLVVVLVLVLVATPVDQSGLEWKSTILLMAFRGKQRRLARQALHLFQVLLLLLGVRLLLATLKNWRPLRFEVAPATCRHPRC